MGQEEPNKTLEPGFFLYAKIISKWGKILFYSSGGGFLTIFYSKEKF